jgi:hypothetical protein
MHNSPVDRRMVGILWLLGDWTRQLLPFALGLITGPVARQSACRNNDYRYYGTGPPVESKTYCLGSHAQEV